MDSLDTVRGALAQGSLVVAWQLAPTELIDAMVRRGAEPFDVRALALAPTSSIDSQTLARWLATRPPTAAIEACAWTWRRELRGPGVDAFFRLVIASESRASWRAAISVLATRNRALDDELAAFVAKALDDWLSTGEAFALSWLEILSLPPRRD